MRAISDDDEHFRQLAEGVLRGQSREVPKPLPKRAAPKPKTAVVLPIGRADLSLDAIEKMEARQARSSETKAAEEQARAHASKPRTTTRPVKVESPYGRATNGFDKVERIVDTIDLMLSARQIDRDQEAAARMVQDAWEAAPGAIRCALSAGEGGAGPGSRSITSQQEWAGGILNDVRNELGAIDSLVIVRVCGIGMSVEQAARMEFAIPETMRVSERQRDHIGMRLRMGLPRLARLWRVNGRRPRVGHGSADNRNATAVRDAFSLNGAEIGTLSERERAEIGLERVAAQPKRKVRGRKRAVQRAPQGA